MTNPHTNKDGWEIHDHYAVKGTITISKCLVGEEVKYVSWEGKEFKGVHDTFEKAKYFKPVTDKDWKQLGVEYGIEPRPGESWVKFKVRIQERIN